MSHDRVFLMMPCELERKALIAQLSVDAPHVDVWYEEAGRFVPANTTRAVWGANVTKANLLVCDLSRTEPACEISSAVLRMLLMQSMELSILCLLPDNHSRLLFPKEFATSLEGIVDIVRRNSQRSRYPLDLHTFFPFHYSNSS